MADLFESSGCGGAMNEISPEGNTATVYHSIRTAGSAGSS